MSDFRPPGVTLLDGRYQLESLLGRGGMANVFRAIDIHHGRAVAVKILRDEVIDSVGIERFRREIAVAAAFTHPHILGLLESGETTTPGGSQLMYYVMPLIDGESLRSRLEREDHLSLRDAVRITREILDGLRYAHEHGVIHRDIKPANILLCDGHAVVADFGIARPVIGTPAKSVDIVTLTVSGVAVGTPAYMSPEQALGGTSVDARCDLYGAGCVLYEMLTGHAPFEASTGQAVMARKITGAFVPPSLMRPGLPPAVDDIVARALRPDPADRFASASEFLSALDVLGDTTSANSAMHGVRSARRPPWRRYGATGAITLVVAALAGWMWMSARKPSAADPATNGIADPARLAVLPFENLSADTSLAYVANGITTDLIDQLAQVQALTVVSKNGVLPFLGKAIAVDSMARALRVGSVITGDVRRRGDRVSVSVRLVDGRTGQQLANHDTSGTMEDLLAVRSTIVDDVARFLRARLGEQVRLSAEQRQASNTEAWELVQRVRALRSGELNSPHTLQLSPADRDRRFQHADSLALVASRLDKKWPEPLIERALVSMWRASAEELVGLTGGVGAERAPDATAASYRDAIRRCDDALIIEPNNASALRIRGQARMALWRVSRDAGSDSLRALAEVDLRAALDRRPNLSAAWNNLSSLLSLTGDFAEAEHAAAEALRSDEYLTNAPEVLSRLQFAALGAEHMENAARWCAEGRRRYPAEQRFFACELTTLGWTASGREDVGRAWRILADAEKRYTPNILGSGFATRRLFVAAVAARAGMRDSALAIVARTRAEMPQGASTLNLEFGEAHVRALLGQTDEALRLLERFLRSVPIQRRQVARMPWFRSLRADPRFVDLTNPR